MLLFGKPLFSSSNHSNHLTSVLPSKLELTIFGLISALLLAIGSIKSVSNLLGVTDENKQDIDSFFGDSFSFLLDKIQLIPFSDTLVVFVINFLIALLVINAITYTFNEYKKFKADIKNINNSPNAQFMTKKNFWSKIFKNYAERTFLGGFGIIWIILFFLLVLPIGIKLSNLYLTDIGNLLHIFYLIIGFLVVLFGIVAWAIYFKILFNQKWFS